VNIEIFDVEQNTRDWLLARCGMPTASCFDKVLAQPRKGASESKTRNDYLYQLADEVIYGDPVDSYTNADMERGKAMEAEACSIYALENDAIPQQVGFVKNHDLRAGCSPDRFIGTDGLLQVKTSYPKLWVPHVIHGTFPAEHVPQIQGELLVTGRKWCDLMIYWPGRYPHIVRVLPDPEYQAKLALALKAFNKELDIIVAAMRTKVDLEGTLKSSLEAAQ
jgi:hypothetical protein